MSLLVLEIQLLELILHLLLNDLPGLHLALLQLCFTSEFTFDDLLLDLSSDKQCMVCMKQLLKASMPENQMFFLNRLRCV